jgi:hypothetical protein
MKTTKKATAVATTNDSVMPITKADVPAAIEKLEAQLAALRGNRDEEISLNISYNGTNIKDVTTVKELLEISSSINARSAAYAVEAERYNVVAKVRPFMVSEKTAEEWVKIIGKAINELINKKQIETLESAIKKMSKHLDEETKLQKELAEIMQLASEKIA